MRGKKQLSALLLIAAMLLMAAGVFPADANAAGTYTVKSGDTLWKIANTAGITVSDLKLINNLTGDTIMVGQIIKTGLDPHLYTVKTGDSLWIIANQSGTSVNGLKTLNALSGDTIYVGQTLKTMPDTMTYVVCQGDSLYKIATKLKVTVADIKSINNLTSDMIYTGQKLLVAYKLETVQAPPPTPLPRPAPVKSWPSVTYIVQAGDTASSIAKKFGVSAGDIMKYNYMTDADWFNAGEKIAINGYAPRNYAVVPGEDAGPAKYGHLVDWFLDGKYLLKRNSVLKITDVQTGKSFSVKVMGGYNHADVEPVTASDTKVMKDLWPSWGWSPRPVVIYKDGMNIAASLSGMPHSYDTVSENGVSGHFDCYLLNSIPHSSDASQAYVSEHYTNIYKAAGKN